MIEELTDRLGLYRRLPERRTDDPFGLGDRDDTNGGRTGQREALRQEVRQRNAAATLGGLEAHEVRKRPLRHESVQHANVAADWAIHHEVVGNIRAVCRLT